MGSIVMGWWEWGWGAFYWSGGSGDGEHFDGPVGVGIGSIVMGLWEWGWGAL